MDVDAGEREMIAVVRAKLSPEGSEGENELETGSGGVTGSDAYLLRGQAIATGKQGLTSLVLHQCTYFLIDE
jgi:hypothetical protein